MGELVTVREAQRLHIPVFGLVDTNSSPDIDYVIPANDDATKSVSLIIDIMAKSIQEGLDERNAVKEKDAGHSKDKNLNKANDRNRSSNRKRRARKDNRTNDKVETREKE